MTVTAIPPFVVRNFIGAGDYDFNFLLYDTDDLVLTHISVAGVVTTLNDGEFSSSTLSPIPGGTVTVTTGALGSSGILHIRRVLPYVQGDDWVNNEDFDMELFERSIDQIVMMIQQISTEVGIAVTAITWRGDWSTPTGFLIRDLIVGPDGNWYACLIAHTSGTWATDLAAGYWALALDLAALTAIRDFCESALNLTAEDVVLTHADVVLTHADVVLTHADVVLTHADATQTALDRISTGENSTSAEAALASTLAARDLVWPLATSISSNFISPLANKTFQVGVGKRFLVGSAILAVYNNDPAN